LTTGLDVLALVGGVLEHLIHGGAAAADAAESLGHAPLGRDHGHDLELRALAKIVESEHVQRIRHRHEKLVSEAADGREFVLARHVLGHEFLDFLGHAHLREIHGRHVEAAAHGDHHVLLGDVLFVGEQFQQASALLFLDLHGLGELAGEQEPVLDQDVRDAFSERFNAHFSIL
jgi:hypothetical protein